MAKDTVTISKEEYDILVERDRWLTALEDAGVDNWSGIGYAYDTLREWDEAGDE